MSTWPNTPVGATVLLDADLNKSTLASVGIFDIYNTSIAGSDATAPVSPSSTIISRMYAGNNYGGMQLNWYAPTTYTDLFVAFSWRTNAGFQLRTTANKMWFMRGPGVNGFFGITSFNAGTTNNFPVYIGFGHNTGTLDNSHAMAGDLGLIGYPNVNPVSINANTWTRIEAYIKKSTTATSRDGIVRWWVNNTLCGNYTNINYAPAGLNEWVWSETWDGTVNNPVPSVNWEHHLDHLFIATGGAPATGGGGTTPVLSTLSPSNVALAPGNAQLYTVGMSSAVSSTTTIALSSSASAVASVASSAIVNTGNSSANFSVTGVGAGSATITASLGSVALTSAVTVTSGGGTGGGGSTTSPTTYAFASQFSGTQSQNQWSYRDTGGNLLTYNAGGSKWEGDELYLAIWGTGFVHSYSGSSKGAVLRWTSPGAGNAVVSGAFTLYDPSGLGTVEVEWNGASLFGPQTMSYGVSYPYSVTQVVAAEDVIDFIMMGTSRGTNDNTQLNPVIVFTPTSTGSGNVTVSSMTPSHGNIGSSVIIVGTGFSATAVNNTVTVNGVPATITSASTTQLIFTVPSGATTGLVNVSTSAGSVSAGTYTVDDPVTPDVPPATNFGGSAMLLLVMP